MTFFRKGQIFGKWELSSYLGGGGNGEVWVCKNPCQEENAIKILKHVRDKPYRRFIDETIVIEQNSDIKGIIPIKEKFLPDILGNNLPYYIMPIAESSEKKINSKSINEKVDAIIQVAETLSQLHQRGIFHRDIKPANILFYNSRYTLTDFGLVDYPNKKEISLKNEEIGPKWTMAPEMKRESSKADYSKADIYSLAKTLWIYLTENKKGFDGQYSTDSIIHLKKYYPQSYTSPIDNLLIASTDNDPCKRPSIDEFINILKAWKELTKDFHSANLQQWFEIQTKLFPMTIPSRVIWDDINDIVKILKVVCSFNNLNHMFFPISGGLDLEDVRLAHEEGCIELDSQSIHIVKPKRLLFESFGYNHEWNYFRLETEELKPSGVYETEDGEEPYERSHDEEAVSELSPGQYYPYYIMEDSSYYKDDYPITDFSRHITRGFRGSFVIFCKRSPYNLDVSTYDGRHNKMTTDEFRKYIQRSVDICREEDKGRPFIDKILDKSDMRLRLLRKQNS